MSSYKNSTSILGRGRFRYYSDCTDTIRVYRAGSRVCILYGAGCITRCSSKRITAGASPTSAGVGVLAASMAQSGAGCDFSFAAAEIHPGSSAAQQPANATIREMQMHVRISASLPQGPRGLHERMGSRSTPTVPGPPPQPSGRTRANPGTLQA